MAWFMVIFGIALCAIGIHSIFKEKKKNADTDSNGRRRNMAIDTLFILVGIGGILIGSGIFRQYVILDEVILWVIILCQFIAVIAIIRWRCSRK